MSEKPLVSVIIPTYNRSGTILRSVNSVLEQTFSNIEVIVVDDFSSDNTKEIINDIIDPRLRYIKLEKNMGACAARNKGIHEAKGDFIAFQDSDDEWINEKLDKQLSMLLDSNADIIACKIMRCVDESTSRYRIVPSYNLDITKNVFEQILYENCIATPTILCRRKCFDFVSFDESYKRFQDWDIALQLAKHYKFVFCNELLVRSYLQKDSITINVSSLNALLNLYNKYKNDISNNSIIHARYLEGIADCYRLSDRHKSISLYTQSINLLKSKKVWLKREFTRLHLDKLLLICTQIRLALSLKRY